MNVLFNKYIGMLPNDITIYIYKLIHIDLVASLNREYKQLKSPDAEYLDIIGQAFYCIRFNLKDTRSERDYMYFNYRILDDDYVISTSIHNMWTKTTGIKPPARYTYSLIN